MLNQTGKTLLRYDSSQWKNSANSAQEEVFQKRGADGFWSPQKHNLSDAKFLTNIKLDQ